MTKKIGNAVVRNRMKRRLRALARALLPEHGLAGADHVLIGRAGGVAREFGLLEAELRKALGKTIIASFPGEGRGPEPQGQGLATLGPGLRRGRSRKP